MFLEYRNKESIILKEEINSENYRLLKKKDLDTYFDLIEICYKETNEFKRTDLKKFRKITSSFFNPVLKSLLKLLGAKFYFFTAEIDGKIVGATTLSCVRNKGLISAVMTHPDYRRRGIGRKLFTMASQKAKELKKEFLWLDVDAQNKAAIKLYEKEGFKTYYQYGIFDYNLEKTTKLDLPDSIHLKELTETNPEHINQIFEDSFPVTYWEYKDREKEQKRYKRTKKRRIIPKLLGSKSKCFGIFLSGENNPRGYLITSYDKFNKAIEVKSPIILESDANYLSKIIPQLPGLLPYEEVDKITLFFSNHRKELIKHIEKVGFTKSHEMREMYKRI
ncbi:MAG: GNAT family N-acetyltransferase [Asgard group archaeon]|nr:GNAT family N-acetyltransferase [Asgard group archaeon]